MTAHESSTQEPASDRFTDEDGKEWFWTGNYTAEQARIDCYGGDDEGFEHHVSLVRGDVEFIPDSEHDLYLNVTSTGAHEWWQVEWVEVD